MKVLIVEDEAPMAAHLRRGLAEEGFAVDHCADADSADEAVHVHDYDAVVLDVMLPGRDGFTLCRRWREAGIRTPILMLTARDSVIDRVRGLNMGADDYLVKPFAFEELLARLQALLRRGALLAATSELRGGGLTLDTAPLPVTPGGRPLSPRIPGEHPLGDLVRHNGRGGAR